MEMTIEMLIYEIAFRIRVFRMLQEAKNKIGDLTDREMILMEILSVKDNVRISDICLLYPSVSSSTISNTISKLWRDDKLVDKRINPDNQRETTVSLTAKGKKIAEEIRNTRLKVYKTITEAINLTESEEEVFKKILSKGIEYFNARLNI